MSVIGMNFITKSCDAEGCGKTATFESDQRGIPANIVEEHPWLKTGRAVQTADGRILFYCSDVCEVKGVETANHNVPEPKTIAPVTGGTSAVAAAAAEARRRQQTDEKLREGQPVKVALS